MKDNKFESQEEIDQALVDGEKLRRNIWRSGRYVFFDSQEKLKDNHGFFTQVSFYDFKNWSIYKPPREKTREFDEQRSQSDDIEKSLQTITEAVNHQVSQSDDIKEALRSVVVGWKQAVSHQNYDKDWTIDKHFKFMDEVIEKAQKTLPMSDFEAKLTSEIRKE